jgi:hypothetical protein
MAMTVECDALRFRTGRAFKSLRRIGNARAETLLRFRCRRDFGQLAYVKELNRISVAKAFRSVQGDEIGVLSSPDLTFNARSRRARSSRLNAHKAACTNSPAFENRPLATVFVTYSCSSGVNLT